MYTADDFPANFSVYAYLANQQFTFVGFPNQDQHQANCNFCQTVSLSTGLEGAQRLVATAQLNAGSPAVSRPFEGQPHQLCPTHPAEHASDSSGYEIFAAGQPETPLCTHGFYSEAPGPLGASTSVAMHTVDRSGQPTGIRYLLTKFSDIHQMVQAQSMLFSWSRKLPLSDIRIRLESWLKIVAQSQQLFPPQNISQMLPEIFSFRGISLTGSKNRLNLFSLVRYHEIPVGFLQIISNRDEDLLKLLLTLAHVDKSASEPSEAHLSKVLTLQRLRTGFYGAVITQVGKVVSRFIAHCTVCTKLRASVVPVQISDKWVLRLANEKMGCITLFAWIS